jgi:predicted RecB family nuclease
VEKKWIFSDGLPTVTYSYEYNSQNALTKTIVQISTESFYHFYEYDRLGQLVKVYTSTDGSQPAYQRQLLLLHRQRVYGSKSVSGYRVKL